MSETYQKITAGLDEAGRGAWAGPVMAGACILSEKFPIEILDDSKKISPLNREKIFNKITKICSWSVGQSSAREIERLGLIRATNLAMQRALDDLTIKPNQLLVDGRDKFHFHIPYRSFIKGDERIPAISAASIIAKVSRDRYMQKLEKKERYFFAKHKGYGTALHLRQMKKYGISTWHRKNFAPVERLIFSKK